MCKLSLLEILPLNTEKLNEPITSHLFFLLFIVIVLAVEIVFSR